MSENRMAIGGKRWETNEEAHWETRRLPVGKRPFPWPVSGLEAEGSS
jgi:hypothetical protein